MTIVQRSQGYTDEWFVTYARESVAFPPSNKETPEQSYGNRSNQRGYRVDVSIRLDVEDSHAEYTWS